MPNQDKPKTDKAAKDVDAQDVAPQPEDGTFNHDNDGPVPPPKNPMDPPLPDTTDDAQKDNRDVNE